MNVVDLAAGETPPVDFIDALSDPGIIKSAFNASFERICLSVWLRRVGALHEGEFLDPAQWRCSRVAALAQRLPGSLGELANFLELPERKDPAGDKLVGIFKEPDRVDPRVEEWNAFKSYCAQDVRVEREVRLTIDALSEQLQEQYVVDQRINDRGFLIDVEFVRAAASLQSQTSEDVLNRLNAITGLANARSNVQFKAWLQRQNYEVSDVSGGTLSLILEDASKRGDTTTVEAVSLKNQVSASASKKFQAMLNYVNNDSRSRGSLSFLGAHTGRWAARGVQVQNLARTPSVKDLGPLREQIRSGEVPQLEGTDPSALLGQMSRTAIVAPAGEKLLVVDYASIEARVLAWISGHQSALEVFARGDDIYCATASEMYGVPVEKDGVNAHLRQLGKIAVLGCGYGAGTRAIGRMNPDLDSRAVKEVVDKWRASNSPIVEFWSASERSAVAALRYGAAPINLGPLIFAGSMDSLLVTLPSGRQLHYRHARPVKTDRGWQILYDDPAARKKGTTLYGGKIVENVTQAIARDLLGEALVRLDRFGFKTVLHVHDEVVVEGPEALLGDIVGIMTENPSWAEGLPLSAEGAAFDFYQK